MNRSEFLTSALFFALVTSAWAETPPDPIPATAKPPTEPAPPIPTSTTKSPLIQIPSGRVPVKTAKRGPRREQKETEGTEAPERFEADTIIKSPYSVDGKPLEVDPD